MLKKIYSKRCYEQFLHDAMKETSERSTAGQSLQQDFVESASNVSDSGAGGSGTSSPVMEPTASTSNSENGEDIPNKNSEIDPKDLEEILIVFKSCKTKFECSGVRIDDNITQDFQMENGILKIKRSSYHNIFGYHENMSRSFQTASGNSNKKKSYANSRQKKKIRAGVNLAISQILKVENDKLMRQFVTKSLYLRDLFKLLEISAQNQRTT